MTRSSKTQSYFREIRPSYDAQELTFLNEIIISGLRKLRDTGIDMINFEDFTQTSGTL